MSKFDSLVQLINEKGRKVYVAERDIDLTRFDIPNTVFILQLPDDSMAAGGRGGGLGERRIVKVHHYQYSNGECQKVGEITDSEKLDSLDLPYHATALPVILPDGKEKLVSGVIDSTLVASYKQILH
jgi:hypothetical protein